MKDPGTMVPSGVQDADRPRACKLGCANIRAVKHKHALQCSLRDRPGMMEAVFHRLFLAQIKAYRKDLVAFPWPLAAAIKGYSGDLFSLKVFEDT